MRIISFVIILAFMLGSLLFFGYMHESVHKIIYRNYGIESEIYMFRYFPDAVTIAEADSIGQCDENCLLAHEINEVVGYHLLPMFIMLVFMLFVIAMEVSNGK